MVVMPKGPFQHYCMVKVLCTVLCAVHTIFLLFVVTKKLCFVCFQKYVAVGELGKATDTLDATGIVILEKEFGM